MVGKRAGRRGGAAGHGRAQAGRAARRPGARPAARRVARSRRGCGARRARATGGTGRDGWRPRSAPCGPGSSPPPMRSAGCARASPRRRTWPTGAGSRSRRTAPSPATDAAGHRRRGRRAGRGGGPARAGAARGRGARHGSRRAAGRDGRGTGTGALDAGPVGATTSAGPAIGVPAPPDGTPADNAGWWSALSPAARQRVVAEHPEWVGNRDGVPAAVRDEANRALLDARAGRLDADLRAVQARYDALTAGGPGAVEAVWLAQRNDLLARLDALRRRREVLDAVRTAAAGTDRSVLLLDLDRTHPRAAVAVGDVDTAEHVAVLTPGFGTTVRGGLGAEEETAAALRDRSLSALGGAGRGGESVAAVAWLGYDVPAGVGRREHARRRPQRRRGPGPLLRRDRRVPPRRSAPHRARPLLRFPHHGLCPAAGARRRRRGGVRLTRARDRPRRRPARASGAHRRRRGPVGPGRGSRVVRRRPEPAGRRDRAVGPPRDPSGRLGDGGLGAARRLPDSGHDQPVQHRRDRRRPARRADPRPGRRSGRRRAGRGRSGGDHEDRPCARDSLRSDARHPCGTAVRPRRRGAPAGSRRGPA